MNGNSALRAFCWRERIELEEPRTSQGARALRGYGKLNRDCDVQALIRIDFSPPRPSCAPLLMPELALRQGELDVLQAELRARAKTLPVLVVAGLTHSLGTRRLPQ